MNERETGESVTDVINKMFAKIQTATLEELNSSFSIEAIASEFQDKFSMPEDLIVEHVAKVTSFIEKRKQELIDGKN